MELIEFFSVILGIICIVLFFVVMYLREKILVYKGIKKMPETIQLTYILDNAITSCEYPVYFRDENCVTYNNYEIHMVNVKDVDNKVIMIDLKNN